ncbi:alpha/beta fold hydrolase [Blastopirellula marina]|uniref:alpha/beta fold hydrolase n=1 Tax=Blastopirellula marina TaxID=124 RepID=UPI0018EB652B|nr:alpha/beta fold hydrolase [Blastopirellula marina]
MERFDFIIIGTGPGGSVAANRLSENPDAQVLVLEAGGPNLPLAVDVPWRWNELLLTELDWAYFTVPQKHLAGRRVYSAAGKALGGGSSVYHMMHVRARPADLDGWAYDGCHGWSFDDCLPFFEKLERQLDNTNPTAGKHGPLTVMNAKEMGNPISATFIEACAELGYPVVDDFNKDYFGAGWQHVNIENGKRGGVVPNYLLPALRRQNVTLATNARATRLRLEKGRCVGVEYEVDGKSRTAYANEEVIVSCGSIESPKLLLLSGIGPADQLNALGIPVNVDLPGVGENFHDHPLVIGPFGRLTDEGSEPRGNMTESALFWGASPGMPAPDLEICLVHRAPFGEAFFENVVKRLETGQPVPPVSQLVDKHVILSLPGLVRPLSRGSIRLASRDPHESPLVDPNYFAEPVDLQRMVKAVQIAREIYDTQAFAKLGLQEIGPGPAVATETQLFAWVQENVGSFYHFAGSCKMGIDRMAVVDPELKVHGVEGLRIADGSIMPAIPSGNPHATIVMIGERVADFIQRDAAQRLGGGEGRAAIPAASTSVRYPQSERQFFELGDYRLIDGRTLPGAKLLYKTMGTLNERKDNAILFPHFLGGAPEALEGWIGPGRPLDPTKYFFVLPGQLGVDPSSAPSNTAMPYDGPAFPQTTIGDDVCAQHKLLIEGLGVTSLELVLGWSVGAIQTYDWAVRFPTMPKRILSVAGAPKPSPWTRLWLKTVVEEPITSDPGWNNGRYTDSSQVSGGLRRQGHAAALTLPPHSFYDEGQEAWRSMGFTSNEDFVSRFWEAFWLPQDPNSLVLQARKTLAADPGGYGDVEKALQQIQAKTFVFAFTGDPMFPPHECRRDASRIPGATFREIQSQGGHLTTFGLFESDRKAMDEMFQYVLNS